MRITESRLRQIINEEARALAESYGDRTPRGMAGPRGPRDTDYTRDMAYGRGAGGRRQTMGGRDEEEYGDMGGGFMQKFMKGDRVRVGDQEATVLYASEVDSAVRVELDGGGVTTFDGDYLERA